jgi:hypothetical protein
MKLNGKDMVLKKILWKVQVEFMSKVLRRFFFMKRDGVVGGGWWCGD